MRKLIKPHRPVTGPEVSCDYRLTRRKKSTIGAETLLLPKGTFIDARRANPRKSAAACAVMTKESYALLIKTGKAALIADEASTAVHRYQQRSHARTPHAATPRASETMPASEPVKATDSSLFLIKNTSRPSLT